MSTNTSNYLAEAIHDKERKHYTISQVTQLLEGEIIPTILNTASKNATFSNVTPLNQKNIRAN